MNLLEDEHQSSNVLVNYRLVYKKISIVLGSPEKYIVSHIKEVTIHFALFSASIRLLQ